MKDLRVYSQCNKVFYVTQSIQAVEDLGNDVFELQRRWERHVGLEETVCALKRGPRAEDLHCWTMARHSEDYASDSGNIKIFFE